MLEVIACSVEDAIAAEQGGADRLEIIVNYEVGGLTPPVTLVEEIINSVKIPLRVMLRDDEDFFVTDQKKIERLCRAARSFSDLHVSGLVLGFLKKTPQGVEIDHQLLARLLAEASGLKATFHRAFELLSNPLQAIRELKDHAQIDKILTGLGDDPWQAKIQRLALLENAARPQIHILPGGGLDLESIRLLRKFTKFEEFHVGRIVREGERIDGPVLSESVRKVLGEVLSPEC